MPETPAQSATMSSITTTTAVALGTSSGGAVLIWLIKAWDTGHMLVPTDEVAMTLVAFLAPIFHATLQTIVGIINAFGRRFGANGNGNGNGAHAA